MFNFFRRANTVNTRQKKVGKYGTRVASQRTELNKLNANRKQLNAVAENIVATRKGIAEMHRKYTNLRKNYETKYIQYKKNARRVLGNNRSVMAKLGLTGRRILAERHKNAQKGITQTHENATKVLRTAAGGRPNVPMGEAAPSRMGGAPRLPNNLSKVVSNAGRGRPPPGFAPPPPPSRWV